MPLVDRRVVLEAGVGALPGGDGDLLPEVAGLVGLGDFAVAAELGVVGAVRLDGLHELVADPHRVVGVLAADGVIGLAVEVGGEAAVLSPA